MTISTKAKALVAGLAAAATVGSLATTAAAQAYPGYGPQVGSYYDPCSRDTSQRSTVGGLSGAAIGAAIGSGIAARGVRTEGAVLGGLLGAVVGAKVGHDTAACSPGAYPQPSPYAQPAPMPAGTPYSGAPYDARPYAGGYDYGYGEGDRDYGYNSPYQDGGYGQAYGYPVSSAPSAEQCQLAESPIYLPDGRTQKRFVRVCRDASGQYQVVD